MGSSLRCACFSSVALVPVLEEIFWRGWLMRWSIDRNFLAVRLGTYQQAAVWLVAVLFACEHGLYWDVGLITGIVYNLWLIRTGTLADCILAHAITKGTLVAYVLRSGPMAILAITKSPSAASNVLTGVQKFPSPPVRGSGHAVCRAPLPEPLTQFDPPNVPFITVVWVYVP